MPAELEGVVTVAVGSCSGEADDGDEEANVTLPGSFSMS